MGGGRMGDGGRGGKPNLDLTAGMSEGEGGGIRGVYRFKKRGMPH